MIAYKLFKIGKDGSIGSLFFDSSKKYKLNEWLHAKPIRKKGYAYRPGFHCLHKPNAPHLKLNLSSGEQRAWFEVEIEDFEEINRPTAQGGKWFLAKKLKILKQLTIEDVQNANRTDRVT